MKERIRRDVLSPPGDQFDALHGMRAVAAFFVIGFHVAHFGGFFSSNANAMVNLSLFFRFIRAFWYGMDIFFVLSGFLIGRILMTSLATTGSVEFPRFFVRRSMRVFPAYYLVLTLTIFFFTRLDIPALRYLLIGDGGWHAMFKESWMNYIYVMNYAYSAGKANPMGGAWSLCVEEHFYLMLPLMLAILYRTKHRGVRPVVLILAMFLPLLGRAVQYALDPSIRLLDGFYYRTHNRIDEIMVGVVIAYFFVHHKNSLQTVVERLGDGCWIGALLLIGSVGVFGGIFEQGVFAVVFQFLFCALGTGLLVLNCLFLKNRVTRFLSLRIWYPLARVSYGIYLTHHFLIILAMYLGSSILELPAGMPASFMFIYIFTMIGSFLVASAMFMVFERPLIDWGIRISKNLSASKRAKAYQ
ncbi:MAG: acyltransferase [Syntrophaceae bacterium]|nr:acyltransferase [Syntrophaceae bacterium]HOC61377.1 acyltransferase [Smithellaceae bacterium]